MILNASNVYYLCLSENLPDGEMEFNIKILMIYLGHLHNHLDIALSIHEQYVMII